VSDFTISSASTLMGCRFPFRHDAMAPPQAAPDADCELGREVHNCAAKYINNSDAPELLDAATHPVWACARAWILANWKATWQAEPAYAWNVTEDTARAIGVDIDRKYALHGKLPHEVGGTLDVRSLEGDTVYVYEFGTGHDVSHKHEQLRLQCAVAALAHGCTRAVGQLVRFAADGAYPSQPVEFDEFELAAIRGEFAEYLSEVEGSEPTPGEHCGRCSLAPVCPAASSIVAALIPVESLVKPGWGLVIQSPEHAVWLNDMQRLVGKAAEAVKERVKAYVGGGVTLADGRVLYEGERVMQRTDHARVEALARAMGATDEQIEACTRPVVESAGLKVKKPVKAKRARAA
jgi:hypothetical protein